MVYFSSSRIFCEIQRKAPGGDTTSLFSSVVKSFVSTAKVLIYQILLNLYIDHIWEKFKYIVSEFSTASKAKFC